MDRWTQEKLERTDDLSFAIAILNERKSSLNPYSPLSMKLNAATKAIEDIRDEKDRFLRRICGLEESGEEPREECKNSESDTSTCWKETGGQSAATPETAE